MPDSDLVGRLGHWAASMPGMPEAIMRLSAGGYLDNETFLSECVYDLDGTDLAIVDWVAVQQLQTRTGDARLHEAMQAANRSQEEARRWSTADCPPGARV